MTHQNVPIEVSMVPCRTCLTEVPISEVIVSEATDYVAHFCGLECYQKWKNNPNSPVAQESL